MQNQDINMKDTTTGDDVVVLYPSSGRGHLFAMVELGKLITKHSPSISVIILINTLPFEAINSLDAYLANATCPSISFIHLPSIPRPHPTTSNFQADMVELFFELPRLNNPNLRDTLLTLSRSGNIKALVIDFFCHDAVEVSSVLDIPAYFFFTCGACGLCNYLYYPTIDVKVPQSLKDVDIFLDGPGIPRLWSKDMPLLAQDKASIVYKHFIQAAKRMAKSSGIVVNTFEALERRPIQAIINGECTPDQATAQPIYCVGPVVTSSECTDREQECLTWLNAQPSHSVVFLCFGSLGVFSASQLREIASGLEMSGVRFLWVVRHPPPDDDDNKAGGISAPTDPNLETLMPDGFLERTKDRGLVVKMWAPQVAVLNHDSVGAFVTHCGWNSVLEAVSAGVPMLAWPLYAEQKINRVFMVEEMKVALALKEDENGFVSATQLAQRLKELTMSEEGTAIRERVLKMKEMAVQAWDEGGSSWTAMAKFVRSLQQN